MPAMNPSSQPTPHQPSPPDQIVPDDSHNLGPAMEMLVTAFGRFFCDLQLELLREQSYRAKILQEMRRHAEALETVQASSATSDSALVELRRELAQLRQHNVTARELMSQIAADVQLVREFQEKWTEEFISRRVADPLLAGYATALGNLWRQDDSLTDEQRQPLNAIADDMVRFLDALGINLIRPASGDKFDPHRHQPLRTLDTDDPTLHGGVAATFHPGLRRSQRVIQPARVSVFTFKSSTNNK